MRRLVDVLFVDEAGQKSLADVVAVERRGREHRAARRSAAARAAVAREVIPTAPSVSALEHLLGGADTMPDDLGLFLETTLPHAPGGVRVHLRGRVRRQAPTPSPGSNASPSTADARCVRLGSGRARRATARRVAEEAERSRELVDELVGTQVDRPDGDDAQVEAGRHPRRRALQRAGRASSSSTLPDGARIGTVDKFQGQEAPVTIYSMATSRRRAPRGMEFLYDLHRLNVAVSRAQASSILVAARSS